MPSKFRTLLPKEPFLQKRGFFFQLGFLILTTIAGMLIFTAIGVVIGIAIGGEEALTTPAFYRGAQVLSAIGTFGFPALLFSFAKTRNWLIYTGIKFNPTDNKMFLHVLFLSVFLMPLIGFIGEWNAKITLPEAFGGLTEWLKAQEIATNQLLETILSSSKFSIFLLNLFVCAVVPAICEEFFFRGTLQQLFCHWIGNKHIAIWLTGFVFSAIHLQFSGFFARWLLGVYLGYLFWWGGSLWLPIVAHFLHNALSITLHYVATNSALTQIQEMDFSNQLPAVIASAILTTVFISLLYYTYKQHEINQLQNNQ